MKLNQLLISIAALLGLTAPILAASFEVRDPKRYVEVIDVVDGSMLRDVAQKLDKLSQESPAPIDIFINSPGGGVLIGTSILDAMDVAKSRGVELRCFTSVLSASMAFIILANCDERYALPNAKLLFHPMSSGGQGRVQEQIAGLKEMAEVEHHMMKLINDQMRLPENIFLTNYWAETMWSGDRLAEVTGGDGKFLKIVTGVKGIKNVFTIEREKSIFGFKIKQSYPYIEATRILRKAGIVLDRDNTPDATDED